MYGTGFFPTEVMHIYTVDHDELFLVGTSEVGLASFHMGEELDSLPRRYAGYSTNFRRESGAAGKDTRGMFRVHQFDKVEMFVFCDPERSAEEHEQTACDRGVARPGARHSVPRGQHRGGRPRRVGDEEVRHRSVVTRPAALPRDLVDVEHDRLPGATARRPLPAQRASSSQCTR